MLRRDFLIAAAASVAAALPAYADPPAPFRPDLWPPMARRADFVAWMAANRGENAALLGERFDRYQELLSFNDLWTPADKRAFLTDAARGIRPARGSRTAPMSGTISTSASASPITPPGTMGRMTSALGVRPATRSSKSAPAPATSRRC